MEIFGMHVIEINDPTQKRISELESQVESLRQELIEAYAANIAMMENSVTDEVYKKACDERDYWKRKACGL